MTAPVQLGADITCPACGCEFTGAWLAGRETTRQICPACEHVFPHTWPGFPFEPETVVIRDH